MTSNVIHAMKGYRCFCGSSFCNQFACRFYPNREQYEQDTAEFWANWDEAQRRLDMETQAR